MIYADLLPRILDSSGDPIVNAQVFFGLPDVDTILNPIDVYDGNDIATDANLGNELTTDSFGRFAVIAGTYVSPHVFQEFSLEVYQSVANGGALIERIARGRGVGDDFTSAAQVLTDAGAVSLLMPITHIVTTTASALMLADGFEGQRKVLVMKTDGGNATLTPTNYADGTTILFSKVGDSAILLFTDGAWHWIGGTTSNHHRQSGDLYKMSTSIETVNASTTLQDDNELVLFVLEPATYYAVTGHFSFTAASATPDVKLNFTHTNAPQRSDLGWHGHDAASVDIGDSASMTTDSVFGLSASNNSITVTGYIFTHATLTSVVNLQWAQNVSNASDTSRNPGSWLKFDPVG